MLAQEYYTETVSLAIESGQGKLADAIKTLVYQNSPDYFELLDFNNDFIFLEPLLFAWFNQPTKGSLPLEQLLIGYIEENIRPKKTAVHTDKQGILYIPSIGYFKTSVPDTDLTLIWDPASRSFSLTSPKGPVPFSFEPLLFIPNSRIEILLYDHPLHQPIFSGSQQSIMDMEENGARGAEPPEVETITRFQIGNLKQAWNTLAVACPYQFNDISAVARRVVIFSCSSLWSFATVSAHGTAFFSCTPADGELFFIAELAHQFGHNVLNASLADKEDYFKVNPDEIFVSSWTGNMKDGRNLFSAFHGLYTTTKVAEALDACLTKDVFPKDIDKHELIGRIADNKRRYKTGLEKADHSKLLTEAGMEMYREMDNLCGSIYEERKELIANLKVSNQPFVFNYPQYVSENPRE
jgi:hypothetical protein